MLSQLEPFLHLEVSKGENPKPRTEKTRKNSQIPVPACPHNSHFLPCSSHFFPSPDFIFQVFFLPGSLNSEFPTWTGTILGNSQIPAGFAAWAYFIPDFFFCFFGEFPSKFFIFFPNFPFGSHFQEVFESLLSPAWNSRDFPPSGNENFAPNLGFLGISLLPSPGSTGGIQL